jgi:hypothetical protein
MSLQKNRLFVAVSAAALVASLLAIPLVTLAADQSRSGVAQAGGGEEPFSSSPRTVRRSMPASRAQGSLLYAWSFVAPEATLAENGAIVGHHFAGPTWASDRDLSSVKGTVRERADGGPGNIPWLLATGTSTSTPGRFANVTSVQRLATKGGVEPAAACGESNVGKEVRVPYTADYYFYKRKTSGVRRPLP